MASRCFEDQATQTDDDDDDEGEDDDGSEKCGLMKATQVNLQFVKKTNRAENENVVSEQFNHD